MWIFGTETLFGCQYRLLVGTEDLKDKRPTVSRQLYIVVWQNGRDLDLRDQSNKRKTVLNDILVRQNITNLKALARP